MKLNANGIDINYEIEGEGPVVTFSHSLACNLSMWDEQVRALKGRYRVLRYDTRGHGQTSAPTGAYTLDQLAEDLKGLLDGLGIRQKETKGFLHFVLNVSGKPDARTASTAPAHAKRCRRACRARRRSGSRARRRRSA